jgi:uncharacterized membrane protein SpoIIM required for sporulation
MTPMHFEAAHGAMWDDFTAQLAEAQAGKPVDAALMAARYRQVCENLALAQSRAYPMHLVARLEGLAQTAHQLIYRRQDYGLRALGHLLRAELPRAVRRERRHVLMALALFAVPLGLAFALSLAGPDFPLRLMEAQQLREYESMYGDGKQHLGRVREAASDWQMFGFYVFHNIGIGFRCFGAGILAGVGSALMMIYNGLMIGATAGHLTRAGLGHNFWPFVATHAAFELTGIVLAGAAGLRVGLGWLAPGRMTRLDALRAAARAAVPLVYAAFFLLVVAAAVEAFWSPAAWIAPWVKYSVAATCWALVVGWLGLMGRGVSDAR